ALGCKLGVVDVTTEGTVRPPSDGKIVVQSRVLPLWRTIWTGSFKQLCRRGCFSYNRAFYLLGILSCRTGRFLTDGRGTRLINVKVVHEDEELALPLRSKTSGYL
ncbi:unnamed protein product, partial [Ectocarpus fasciculatus]